MAKGRRMSFMVGIFLDTELTECDRSSLGLGAWVECLRRFEPRKTTEKHGTGVGCLVL